MALPAFNEEGGLPPGVYRFVSGRDRSQPHVREMEGEFAQLLDEDQRFEDLQYALALFGADGYDLEEQLVKECAWAIRTLRRVCVYRDCEGAIVEGTRLVDLCG